MQGAGLQLRMESCTCCSGSKTLSRLQQQNHDIPDLNSQAPSIDRIELPDPLPTREIYRAQRCGCVIKLNMGKLCCRVVALGLGVSGTYAEADGDDGWHHYMAKRCQVPRYMGPLLGRSDLP